MINNRKKINENSIKKTIESGKRNQQEVFAKEKMFEIDYSEPLYFLRENKTQFPQTSTLISVLESLQSVSYYYNLSKNTDREKQLFSYIHEFSATNPEKALQELNPVMNLIPSGVSVSTALKFIISIKKPAEYN